MLGKTDRSLPAWYRLLQPGQPGGGQNLSRLHECPVHRLALTETFQEWNRAMRVFKALPQNCRLSGLHACALATMVMVLSGCASTNESATLAQPVLYPNATLNRVGAPQGQLEVNACKARAAASGLQPVEQTQAVSRRAGEAAATTGVASAVGALLTGRGGEGALRAGAVGAAVGGSAGAVSGSFHADRPNNIYRQFVQRCLSEKGFEVIGWQ